MAVGSFPKACETVCYNAGLDLVEVIRDICALVNNQGGEIYCGVNEKLKIIGVEPISFMYNLNLLIELIVPSDVERSFEKMIIKNKYIIKLKVDSSIELVSIVSDTKEKSIFYRLENQTVLASKIISKWILLKKGIIECKELNNEVNKQVTTVINSFKSLTLSQLYSKIDLPKSTIDGILPVLLYLNEISIIYSNERFEFIS